MTTNTMVALRSTTLASSASSVTLDLTGITGYTDLMIVCSPTNNQSINAADFTLNFNGDTTSGLYSQTILTANGSLATSKHNTGNNNSMYLTYYAAPSSGNPSTWIMNIQNYANTTTYKTVLARGNNAASGIDATVGLWRNTNAIISILVSNTVGTFSAGSTFTLYGIANADIGAYATGGIITQDSTYYYHAFGSSGTFTPSRALTADILVVAGGGGGATSLAASYNGGGGGAGGLLTLSSQSLSSGTGYTCTIGGPGAAGSAGGNSVFNTSTAHGGGGGGTNGAGGTGGSGGGGGGAGTATGGTSNASGGELGNAGGVGSGGAPYYYAGGGGGAGTAGIAGTAGTTNIGQGGAGYTSALLNAMAAATSTGQLVSGNYYYAGGGGAGGNNTQALGGAGGGGAGGYPSTYYNGVAGTPYTGGGGGGGQASPSSGGYSGVGGLGGSGIIIVRYLK